MLYSQDAIYQTLLVRFAHLDRFTFKTPLRLSVLLNLALEEDATLQTYVDSFASKEDLISVSSLDCLIYLLVLTYYHLLVLGEALPVQRSNVAGVLFNTNRSSRRR